MTTTPASAAGIGLPAITPIDAADFIGITRNLVECGRLAADGLDNKYERDAMAALFDAIADRLSEVAMRLTVQSDEVRS